MKVNSNTNGKNQEAGEFSGLFCYGLIYVIPEAQNAIASLSPGHRDWVMFVMSRMAWDIYSNLAVSNIRQAG